MTRLTLHCRDRVLVLAPHPDDETLAAGGLLQQAVAVGAPVRVLIATSGENNPWAQRAVERRWRLGRSDRDRWGVRRRGEAFEALRRLGVACSSATFLGFRDQGITGTLLERGAEAVLALARALAAFRPTIVVGPALGDRHPDHNALAVLLRLALARLAVDDRPARVLSYFVHPRPAYAAHRHACSVRLTPDQVRRKRAAILAHRTQLRLRPHSLLAFADARETFVLAGRGNGDAPDGPVRSALIEGAQLRVEVARGRHLGVFGPSLLRVTTDGAGGAQHWYGRLPHHDREFRMASVGADHTLMGWFGGDRSGGEVLLPAAIVAGAHAAFVKIERRFGFFDEGGWSELRCRGRREAAAQERARAVERLAPLGQDPGKDLPDVRDVVGEVELARDAGALRFLGDPHRVVAEHLVATRLDEERRQAVELGVERGGERRPRIDGPVP
jgi:LmbE family N-acetylglucosaminyl deacetylase